MSFVGVNDAVFSDGHGIAFDVLRYTFCSTRLQFEVERLRNSR